MGTVVAMIGTVMTGINKDNNDNNVMTARRRAKDLIQDLIHFKSMTLGTTRTRAATGAATTAHHGEKVEGTSGNIRATIMMMKLMTRALPGPDSMKLKQDQNVVLFMMRTETLKSGAPAWMKKSMRFEIRTSRRLGHMLTNLPHLMMIGADGKLICFANKRRNRKMGSIHT